MASRIKKGQKVKVGNETDKYFGKTGEMIRDDGSDWYPYRVKFNNGKTDIYYKEDLILLDSKVKPQKSKRIKVNFLLKYELEEDPIEEFETIKQVEERIKELSEDENLQEDSIIVYDVSRVRKITIKKETVISGL